MSFWDRFRQPQDLRPGRCECGHNRSTHVRGKGRCKGAFPPDEETAYWTYCACEIYIRDDSGGEDKEPETPSPSELEKMYQLK